MVGEPVLKYAPGGNSFVAKQAHQLSPDECRGFYVIGTATQSADPATEVPGEGTHAAAGQIGQQAPGDAMRAEDVERKRPAGQRAEKRLLESSEVNDRGR